MISRKTDYALRGLVYLAGQKEGEWIPSSILIKKLRVPPVFWAKIVQTLVKNKIIGSRKGKDGG
ncbi:MAG: Rrf2 family transcriptional regulator, partial [bacterium]